MRTPILVAAVLLLPALAVADDRRRDLGVDEIRAQFKAADAEIGRCYVDAVGDRAGAGRLDITLDIHRTGIVDRVVVATPGLPAKLAKRVDTCVRTAIDGLKFPMRRASTTATVPYFYQRTSAPCAGPQHSCWNPKGCPSTEPAAAPTSDEVTTSKARKPSRA